MCGIVGMAGDLTVKDVDIFEDMLDVCQLRGRDSTGVIRVNRTGSDYTWAKQVGPPSYLKESREYDRQIRQAGLSALVGHCRHKTIGNIDRASAHPFDIEERGIIGVHNGTLKSYYSWPQYKTGMVDSQVLYERLAVDGPETTFAEVEGAFACVWWDQAQSKLFFIRNDERPLYFTYSEDKRKMFWASEPWMFGAVYRKQNLWDGGENKQVYVPLEVDTLFGVEVNPGATKDKPVFKISEGKKIEKKPRPAIGYGGHSQWQGNRTGTNTNATTTTTSTSSKTQQKGGEVANPFRTPLNDELPHHLTVTAKRQGQTTKSGTTHKSNETSSTHSKPSSDQSQQSTNIIRLPNKESSPQAPSSQNSLKTSRKKLSVVCDVRQKSGSEKNATTTIDLGKVYRPDVGVDTRWVHSTDREYITDLRTGVEYREDVFKEKTGGKCCHCGEEIYSLSEVAEIYDEGSRFLCTDCVQPKADPTFATVKEYA